MDSTGSVYERPPFVLGKHCTVPNRVDKAGHCMKDCELPQQQYIDERGVCRRTCKGGWSKKTPDAPCTAWCPPGMHKDHREFCIKGCPKSFVVGLNGRCIFKEYNLAVSFNYGLILGPLVFLLVCSLVLVYRCKECRRRRLQKLERHLAVVLAKIHNSAPDLKARQEAKMGVGSNAENIQQWTDDAWQLFVLDPDQPRMSAVQFKEWLRALFEIA